jgi:filamentous hemagglutinin family protein
MMKVTSIWLSLISGMLICGICSKFANAQIVPDKTLRTSVSQTGNNFTITNGTRIGNNLFHSFSQFSIPTKGSAFFNNASDIQNIFTRVTGGNVSNIDGLIQANGSANLFLLNPNGIIFGSNASLNIGGSFIATTAESIKFADGVKFNVANTATPPLLTMSVPIGLQLGANSGSILVQGTGHNMQFSSTLQVSGANLGVTGLQLQSGKTLALVGGDITLDGGLLSAPGGRIELGSVTGGTVVLNANAQGFSLSYPDTSTFGNIQMIKRALASVTGTVAGSVEIQGRQVNIQDGSLVLVQNQGSQKAGDIAVNATESLKIVGKSADFNSSSSLVNETISSGTAGNIVINTPQLLLDQGGFILNRTFSAAPGGNIIVNAAQVGVTGFAAGDPNAFRSVSQLLAASYGSGKGGNISISTQNLSILAGGNIAARPYASGSGGDVSVKADTIQVTSEGAPDGFYFSLLSTATFGVGNAGNLTVNTRKLSVGDGGRVSASSIVLGNAGSLTINASESIDVSGMKDASNPSYIGSAVVPFGALSQVSRANSGDTTINTSVFNIRDGTVQINNVGVDPNSGLVELPQNVTDSSQKIATGCSSSNGSSFVATGRGGIPQNPNQQLMSDRTWSDVRNLSQYRRNSPVEAKIPEVSQVLIQATGWHRNAQGEIELVAADKSPAQVQPSLTCAAVSKF